MTIENTADALVALCNSMPRTPTREQFIECLRRCEQMPNMQVVVEGGRVCYVDTYYVVADDLSPPGIDVLPVSTFGAFP